ncbi:MAG: biopolymer transporter ExbD [Myxococcota bacterium]
MSTGTGTSDLNPTSRGLHEAIRSRRTQKRREQEGHDDITYLNITPMLDMMTILLVFLLKSFASSASNVNVANLTLPNSTTKLKVEEAIQVLVTPEQILVDNEPVLNLDANALVPGDALRGSTLVEPLYESLANKADYLKQIQEFGGAQFNGKIAILADEGITYDTIEKVLYTAGQAEFGLFRLFVQKPR